MKKRLLAGLAIGVFFCCLASSALAMDISAYDNADNMAAAIVGSGITISNATYTGTGDASGYFTGGTAAGIGINSGIVLTSGFASNLQGTTNTSDGITGDNDGAGSSFLDALVPGYSTHDASILAFDFEFTGGQGGDAYFNFVFGSDEYNEWVNSAYNDVFGFFLDGTAVGNNVALIPGTTTPISINNVNNGLNPSYYNDNDNDDSNAGAYPFEYDGFTDVFTIEMPGLSAGNHTLMLAIADAGDYALDSGVFIQGSSFGNEAPGNSVPEPASMLLMGTGLAGLIGARRKMKA